MHLETRGRRGIASLSVAVNENVSGGLFWPSAGPLSRLALSLNV